MPVLQTHQNLDFSSAFSFQKTIPIAPRESPGLNIPDGFYEQGFAVFDEVASSASAKEHIEQFIGSVDTKRLPLYARFAGRIQLASETLIPTCKSIVETTFQGLHFDMGLPIVSPSPQVVQLVLALYRPYDKPISDAATRVVGLRTLLSQRNWPEGDALEKRLVTYVEKHGDGWEKPMRVNTFRIACFARIIDAADDVEDLKTLRDCATGLEFRDPENNQEKSLSNEYGFFQSHGLNVKAVESQIQLQHGQLLIIDNTCAVHGRIGRREPQEMMHYLYGIPHASPEDINCVRYALLDQFVQ